MQGIGQSTVLMYSTWMPNDSCATLAIDGVWRAHTLASNTGASLPTGHTLLNAALPGGGWPCAQLTELLQGPAGHSEWQLLNPALRQLNPTEHIALVGPPWVPHTPALAAQGIKADQLWWIDAQTWRDRLWASEQLLRCDAVGAVLVWLPQASANGLRRLQMAVQAPRASGQRPPWLFAMRPWAAATDASPAPLRIRLETLGPAGLRVQVIKRRGPPLPYPIDCPLLQPLASLLFATQHTQSYVLDRTVTPQTNASPQNLVGI